MKTCDVVIPTYNNAQVLIRAITAIQAQEVPAGWQLGIVVGDDGSTDNTAHQLKSLKNNQSITYLPGEHSGIAATRNRCLRQSQADVILFLGADILVQPGAVSEHLNFHDQHPEPQAAAVGMITWDPRLRPTQLMEWMAHGARQQNNMEALLSSKTAPIDKYFYGSHTSCKRQQLHGLQFSEKLTGYGHEDIHFGWQLAQKNTTLYVLHTAVGLHHHTYTADNFFRRQYELGKSFHIFTQLQRQPSQPVKMIHRIQHVIYPMFGIQHLLRVIVRFFSTRWPVPRLFAHSSGYELRRGILSQN